MATVSPASDRILFFKSYLDQSFRVLELSLASRFLLEIVGSPVV